LQDNGINIDASKQSVTVRDNLRIIASNDDLLQKFTEQCKAAGAETVLKDLNVPKSAGELRTQFGIESARASITIGGTTFYKNDLENLGIDIGNGKYPCKLEDGSEVKDIFEWFEKWLDETVKAIGGDDRSKTNICANLKNVLTDKNATKEAYYLNKYLSIKDATGFMREIAGGIKSVTEMSDIVNYKFIDSIISNKTFRDALCGDPKTRAEIRGFLDSVYKLSGNMEVKKAIDIIDSYSDLPLSQEKADNAYNFYQAEIDPNYPNREQAIQNSGIPSKRLAELNTGWTNDIANMSDELKKKNAQQIKNTEQIAKFDEAIFHKLGMKDAAAAAGALAAACGNILNSINNPAAAPQSASPDGHAISSAGGGGVYRVWQGYARRRYRRAA
jgi:hypothetical protein